MPVVCDYTLLNKETEDKTQDGTFEKPYVIDHNLGRVLHACVQHRRYAFRSGATLDDGEWPHAREFKGQNQEPTWESFDRTLNASSQSWR